MGNEDRSGDFKTSTVKFDSHVYRVYSQKKRESTSTQRANHATEYQPLLQEEIVPNAASKVTKYLLSPPTAIIF